ncbi:MULTISPECIES: hypothetical protein [unclassified Polaromonas]|jgi:hypothetical protein|uniref:portal protein n=1 Tax=unclassified Polaromonas TaxID=2638319 RepID=UPI000BCE04D0|nr:MULTISPECIES: hypothetical protein [unclassified Polaromonas]OYY34777.1 MAG: hypothetical protein B7Y60_15170 [Polaromonas sp. 35-63-35]OYZ19336.1 MAG: hypothetical protein B7Y28_12420 [Polaromonas sp. 16-63-31]OYZ77538.1 MAG: hypothetical protein B7Y09_16330 [Polaromonas sp. 24-63-21]OZA48479.1 MAG: hypothetical protein B7X88_18190 [Polaromonas sp. 17-63-33]OZA87227.1 MAG: hypothetical protein B7X65_13660 [Polaromonas sp. 39-63-25]
MAKMDEISLLSHLQALEQDSSAFTWGELASERERGMKDYYRQPYGNEEEGLSGIVTSEVQDTIEWILPDLLDIFTSSDQAVSFEPSSEEDVNGAEQATDACNYVFYKQNNGFLNLYTAFKDALMVKNCAVMWRKETKRTKSVTPVQGATAEMLAMLMQEAGKDAEIESATPIEPQPMQGPDGQPMLDMMGQPMLGPQMYNARISKIEQKTTIKVDVFPPEDLLIKRDWTSPLLADCPYVCRNMPVTLSDIHEMGYTDVTVEDLDSSDDAGKSADGSYRMNRAGTNGDAFSDNRTASNEDDSQTQGFLRIEFVLVDFDGDGIAERRCIYRLKDKILKNEEASHVPIATASPILNPHRWDGMSMQEVVSDLQILSTELTRQMVDSGRLALNPRTKVLTDSNGSPYANIDDLLDSRAGGLVRQSRVDATAEMITPWVGGQMFPMLEYKDAMLAKRTGVSGQSQGVDANALNRGGNYETRVMNAAQKRIKLIARVFAEVLLKPTFQGILKLLTEGDMEKLSFRLRNKFVQMDPNEWRDSYDMTANVGLGTGDKEQQTIVLQAIAQSQAGIAMSPFGKLLVTPKGIYNAQAKLVEHAGFKNVGDFWQDPGDKQPEPQQPPPDPAIQLKQMELQADAQKFQATSQQETQRISFEAQAKAREQANTLMLQQQNDERDAQRELAKAQYQAQLDRAQIELDRYKTDRDNETRIQVAMINQQGRQQARAQQEPQA